MAESLIYPTIVSLPLGYDCTIIPPVEQIGKRLVVAEAGIELYFNVVREGGVVFEHSEALRFSNGVLQGEMPSPFVWPDQSELGVTNPAYLEMGVVPDGDRPVFRSKAVLGLYSIYSKPGKKSFFSDNAYKYGSPQVIGQIAEFGRYVDTYPVIDLDRSRNLGETIVLINPYKKAVIAQIRTYDGVESERLRVSPMSVRNFDLASLLLRERDEWRGHIQLFANNRIISFNIKHSLNDPLIISDHEHLDPYRSDPTHMAAFRMLRNAAGRALWPTMRRGPAG